MAAYPPAETAVEHVGNALMILGTMLERWGEDHEGGDLVDCIEIVERRDLRAVRDRLHAALDKLDPGWRTRRRPSPTLEA